MPMTSNLWFLDVMRLLFSPVHHPWCHSSPFVFSVGTDQHEALPPTFREVVMRSSKASKRCIHVLEIATGDGYA